MQLGLSESARATAASESKYRIDYPNSKPRAARVIALDAASHEVLKRHRSGASPGARFLRYLKSRKASSSLPALTVDAVLADDEGRETSLIDEIMAADIVVMVTAAGTTPEAAEVIGNACFVAAKMSTGLVLRDGADEERTAATLLAMRPYAAMLVVSEGEDYVGEMLTALRA